MFDLYLIYSVNMSGIRHDETIALACRNLSGANQSAAQFRLCPGWAELTEPSESSLLEEEAFFSFFLSLLQLHCPNLQFPSSEEQTLGFFSKLKVRKN